MPPKVEKVINGILHWGYYRGESQFQSITMHEYTKEQLTDMLMETRAELFRVKDQQGSQD